MVRNQTITSSLTTTVPTNLAQSLGNTTKRRATKALSALEQTNGRTWPTVAHSLRLPDSRRTFVLLMLALTLIGAGLFLHLLLAISILESRIQLQELDAQYRAIRRDSTVLISAISEETNLARVHARALAAGYQPLFERRYVIQPITDPTAATALDGIATGATSATLTEPTNNSNGN